MKIFIAKVLITVLICSSCKKDDTIEINPVHPQLQNLLEPDIILNEIATGIISNWKIKRIYLQNFNSTPDEYHFEYFDNTNRLKRITLVDPNYSCEATYFTYHYRQGRFIDKIGYKRINSCLEFEFIKIYKYNYENGVLKSILKEDEFSILESYFSYNPDGTIAEMYLNYRRIHEPLDGYSKFIFQYDENSNVISIIWEGYSTSENDRIYSFTYDSIPNPFKGLYVTGAFKKPSLGFVSGTGPFFLSENNVTSIKTEYLNRTDKQPEVEYFEVNTDKKRVIDYGNDPDEKYWFRYYIYYE